MDAENVALLDKENDIYIEIGARLSMEIEGSESPAESIFVGDKTGQYIIVTSPSRSASGSDDLFTGKRIDVKYVSQGQVFEFQTKFIEMVPDPIPLILLEYPELVRERELRSQKRINCFISAIIEIEKETDEGEITGVIKDISKSGCRFLVQASVNAENMFQINEQVTLKCHFPGIAGEQEALGRVMDIQKTEDEVSIGIQFSDILWWVPPYG